MKKLIALLMVIAMVACLFAGCGETDKQGSDAPQGDGDVGTTQNGGNDGSSGEADYSKMKIGMLLNNTVTDGGWNQAMAESMERSKKELGLKDDQVIIVESLPDGSTEADSTIVQLVDEGCNLIIGASSGFTVNVNAAAQQYPDVYFTQFEGLSADNYCSFTCWDIEAIFMCGYAAALMSDVDELGFVAAQPQASVVRAIDAWAAGAKAANPDATVQVAWVNSWYDPAGDKECANSLMQTGIKCLGYHGSTTAVAQAAEEAGAYCTGFHIDMHDFAPKAVLTSFCWNWAPVFNEDVYKRQAVRARRCSCTKLLSA